MDREFSRSNDQSEAQVSTVNKKDEKVKYACEQCRRKKIKCDKGDADRMDCKNCIASGETCQRRDGTRWYTLPPQSYISALESRVERAENLILELLRLSSLKEDGQAFGLKASEEYFSDHQMELQDTHIAQSSISNAKLAAPESMIIFPRTISIPPLLDASRNESAIGKAPQLLESPVEEDVDPIRGLLRHFGYSNDLQGESDRANKNDHEGNFSESTSAYHYQRSMPSNMTVRDKTGNSTPTSDETIRGRSSQDYNDYLEDLDPVRGLLQHFGYSIDAQDKSLKGTGPFRASTLTDDNIDHHAIMTSFDASTETQGAEAFSINKHNNDPVQNSVRYGTQGLEMEQIAFCWPNNMIQEDLISDYFRYINPQVPILNEATFRERLQSTEGTSIEPSTSLQLLGILSLASCHHHRDEHEYSFNSRLLGKYWSTLCCSLLKRNFITRNTVPEYIQALLLSLCCKLTWDKPATFMFNTHTSRSRFLTKDEEESGIFIAPVKPIMESWIFLGRAIRLLQEVKAYRRHSSPKQNSDKCKAQTYQRLWWVSYSLDRMLSANTGRPMAICDEDIDSEPRGFKDDTSFQDSCTVDHLHLEPWGKVSVYDGFVHSVKLSKILGEILQTVYAIDRTTLEHTFRKTGWGQGFVVEFDKTLNGWLADFPQHLLSSGHLSSPMLTSQRFNLLSQYYSTQNILHVPFLKSSISNKEMIFHSLLLVFKASRAGINNIHQLITKNQRKLLGLQVPSQAFWFGANLLFANSVADECNLVTPYSVLEDVQLTITILDALSEQ